MTPTATTLSTLLTQVATTCHLLDEVPTALLTLSHNLQLGCYLLDQVPTMLLTFITQLATMLSTLVTQLATTFVVIVRRELGILHEYVSHHRGEFMRKGYRGREKLVCHTGTIDAAWSALRNCIPKKMSPQSRDLLYAKSWQRRYSLQQKTIETLKRIFWRKNMLFFRLHKNFPMKMSCYCGKTRKHPNCGIFFLEDFHERNSRFATVPSSLKKEKHVLLQARFPVRRDVFDT